MPFMSAVPLYLALLLVHAPAVQSAPSPGTQPSLEQILSRVGRTMDRVWREMSSVTCTELLTEEKLGEKGKLEHKQSSTFDYLLLIDFKESAVSVDESRLPLKTAKESKTRPMLTTSGFATLLLIFHPLYQNNYHFELAGEETINGQKLSRIRFEHIPGTRSTTALMLGGSLHPLDLQGTAWVDPDIGAIPKVAVSLKTPMDKFNIKAFYSVVTYQPQKFAFTSDVLWLPSAASVDLETAHQHWRNLERFTGYKEFSVTSEKNSVK